MNAPSTATFSGHGMSVTKVFHIEQGMKTVTLSHGGTGDFVVDILGAANVHLLDKGGEFKGSVILDVPTSGDAVFAVKADGRWSIRID